MCRTASLREELRRELARNRLPSTILPWSTRVSPHVLLLWSCVALVRPFHNSAAARPMNADEASLTASSPTIIHGVFFPRFPGSDTSDSVHGRDNYPHGSRTGGNNVETFAAEFAQTRSCSVMDLKLRLRVSIVCFRRPQTCFLPLPPRLPPLWPCRTAIFTDEQQF